ncbi:hypothetical protein [Pseudomonas agarici]|uniref:hypothetical protein n=1 Tax=Pseudomonas agarici TaxID=46677 RepID=UPI0015A2B6DE|nr:hypothetical protein [Pseudomonas agarici]NWB90319.1 hypothetical protein [Pseudomonas agarici]
MSKADAFSEFRPSFISVGLGWLPTLFEQAFNNGRPKIAAQLGASNIYQTQGAVGTGVERPLRFGHARAIEPIGDDLSGAALYLLRVEFEGDEIKEVKLTLRLLNPRIVIADETFIPARFKTGNDGRKSFFPLTSEAEPCGFAVLYEPDTLPPGDRFDKLVEGIDNALLSSSNPAGYLALTEDTLVGRLDLSISWKPDTLGKWSMDVFGYSIGTPDGSIPSGLNAARLFSPAVELPFDSLVNRTVGFALELPHDLVDGILIVTGKGEGMSDLGAKIYAKAKRSFNLTDKFAGVLFEGLRVHVLDDSDRPIGKKLHGGVGLTAFAIDGREEKLGNWYTTFLAEMEAEAGEPYLGMFTNFTVSAMLADHDIKQLQIKTRFDKLDAPFSWLEGRDAVISLGLDKWKDRFGNDMEGRSIGLSLETVSPQDVLARLNTETLGMSPDSFRALATSITLAPILLVPTPKAAERDNGATESKRRGYFTAIREEQTILQLFGGYVAGWFFKEAVKVEEIRVVGIGLQVQPKQINDPLSAPDARETALLLDYETDFKVTLDTPALETERTVTARVDGTGFRVAGGRFCWVQVPRGLHDLQLADPGLWKLGALGKILKVVEFSIRCDPVKQIAIRLHLTGDLGILTASDFVFTVDLESGSAAIEAFPSEVRIEKPDVFKAVGKLYIDKVNGVEDIRGSLDVALTSMGWRAYAGLRVTHIDDRHGGMTKASVGSMMLEWPTMIPFFGTGVGAKSLEGLLATHFERNLPAASPAVPADLVWLEKANGNVRSSLEIKELWKPRLGASTVGLGVGLALITNPKLANLNAMLAIEEPGPQVLVFAKLNLFKEPEPNDKEPQSLGKGVLGLLKIDPVNSQMVFAALIDLEFNKFVHFRAPIEIAASGKKLSAWHAFVGHFDNPITATFKVENIAALTAQGWLMAAGDQISRAPIAPNVRKNLPGLALSLGFRVHAQIGPNFLCARGSLATYINASFSRAIFTSGTFEISGELRLFIVSIGASGAFNTQYLLSTDPSYAALFASGEICGKYETLFFSISGCLRLSLGASFSDPTKPRPLVQGVRLVGGANVALFGQGQTAPIDAILGNASEDIEQAATDVALDAVITLDLEAPPRVAPGGGFVARLTRPYENMRFHLGAREGYYVLKQVLLEREVSSGIWQPVDYGACPARWWHPHSPPTGDQPVPTTLALLTRAPLSTANALPDPAQLATWLEALLGNICETSRAPQYCCYMLTGEDRGSPPAGEWQLRAELPTAEIEGRIGRSGATPSPLLVSPRSGVGTPGDPLPGYPAYPAICRVAEDSATGAGLAYLELRTHQVGRTWVHGSITLVGPIRPGDPMLLLFADFSTTPEIGTAVLVTTRSGQKHWARISDFQIDDLEQPGVLQRFHEDHPRWKPQAEGFARLAQMPAYAGHRFALVTIDFGAMGVSTNDLVENVKLSFTNDVEGELAQHLALTLLLGCYRFIPAAEQQRYENDEAARIGNIEGLNEYLKGERVPLLEPDSLYRVVTECDVVAGGTSTTTGISYFRTAKQPPKSGAPYLLGTVPQDRESVHFAAEHPGFCLASADALHILAKFASVRLRITINEDNGAPVLDPGGTLQWHRGISYIPKDIFPDDVTQDTPAGLLVESVASLPTALREALARHGLSCLGPIQLPPGALWIGLDVVLRPLSGYRILVEVVGPGDTPLFPDDPPFLSWQFKTGLAPSLGAQADQIRAARIRHRTLNQPLALMRALAQEDGLSIVADKMLEDALAAGTGDRIQQSGEAQLTVLWERQGQSLQARMIVVVCNEPLLRRTRGVRIEERASNSSPSMIRIAVPADLPCVLPKLSRSQRIGRIEVASSGRVLVAHLDPGSGDAGIALERRSVERIASGTPVTEIVIIAAAVLADRPIPG